MCFWIQQKSSGGMLLQRNGCKVKKTSLGLCGYSFNFTTLSLLERGHPRPQWARTREKSARASLAVRTRTSALQH